MLVLNFQTSMINEFDQYQICLFMWTNGYLASKYGYCILSLIYFKPYAFIGNIFCRRFFSVSDPNYANMLLIPQNPLDCGAG